MATERIGVEAVWIDQSYIAGVNRYMALQKKATDTTEQSAKGMSGAFKGINSTLKTIGVGFTMAAAANEVRKFVRDSIVEFKTFQTGMAEVFTVLPGISGAAMEQMSSQILAASIDMARLPQDTIPALYEALSSGIPPENVFEFLSQASESALAGVSTLEVAVDGLSSVVNSYGQDALSVGRASDIIFTGIQLGKATFDEMANSLAGVTPLAAALGVSFEEVVAALTLMTLQGTDTATAVTQLKGLLSELSQGGSEVSVAFKEITGQTFPEFIQGGGNLQQVMAIIEQAAADAGVGMNEMFSNIRASLGALQLSGDNLDNFGVILGQVTDSTGATGVAAEQFADSLEVMERRTGAATASLKIAVGEALQPAYIWLLQVAEATATGATAWLTYADRVAALSQFNLEAATSTEALQNNITNTLNTLTGFNFGQSLIASATGQYTSLTDALDKNVLAVAGASGSWAEFESTMKATEGVTDVQITSMGNLIVSYEGFEDQLIEVEGGIERYIAVAQTAAFNTGFYALALEQLPPTLDEVAISEQEAEEAIKAATEALLDFHQKTLMGSDSVVDFTGFIIDYATSIGVTSDELQDIAESTGGFSEEQLNLTKIMVEAQKRGEELRKEVELGNITSEEAALILQDEFQIRIEVANAALEQSQATDEATESIKKETSAIDPWILAMQQAKIEMGGLFDQAFKSKNEIGLFTVAVDQLGQQFVTVGGLTGEQASDLDLLSSEYDKTKKALDEYRLGIKGAGMEEEERAEKIGELQTQLGNLAANMAPLQAVTGDLVEINNEAVLNTQSLNEALYEAAVAAEAPAGALATLGVDLGLMTEAEAEAFLKTAALQLKIQDLGAEIAAGMPIEDALADLDEFKGRLDRDYSLIVSTGNLDVTREQIDLFDLKVQEIDGTELTIGFNVQTEEAVAELDAAGAKLAEKLGIAVGEAETQAGDFETATSNAVADVINLKESFDENMNAVSTVTSESMGAASESVTTSTGDMVTSTADNMGQLVSEVDTAMGNAVSAAEGKVGEFVVVGANISQGLADGVLSGQGILTAAVNQVVAAAIAAANESAATESPSRYTTETGLNIALGLVAGMKAGEGLVAGASSDLASISVGAFISSLSEGDFVSSFNDLIFDFAGDIEAPTEAVLDFARATGIYTEEQLEAILIMAQAKDRAAELQKQVEAGTLSSTDALQILRDEFADLIRDANEAAVESTITITDRINEMLSLGSDFGSAGNFFAGLFETQTLDPLQAEIDSMIEESDRLAASISQQTGLFDLDQQSLTDAYYRALGQGNQELANDILEYQALQEQRNEAEKEFAAQQERILELQRQQQELSFLQTQLDLLQTIQDAGLNPEDILGGITLGLDASLPDLIDAMNAAMSAIIEAADDELGIASPSKVFEEKGENVGDSFMLGIMAALDRQNRMMADVLVSSGPAITTLQPEVYVTSPTPQVIVQGGTSLTQHNDFGGNTIGSELDMTIFDARVREIISSEFSK